MGRHAIHRRPQRRRLAGGRKAGTVVVDQVIGALLAIPVVEGPVGQAAEISPYRGDTGLARVRAIGVGAAPIARMRVPIVGSGPGIGVLDLAGWRLCQSTVPPIGDRVPRHERLKVRTSAAHYRLVVIVAERITVGELAEIGRVACGHVVEAHCDGALIGA